ncbi:MAG: APC family permease [Clostridia bacterium]|nr:APC family permease [Clostridia bacterium]
MEEKNINAGTHGGVAGMTKVEMKPIQVAFMLYCLVAAGAFGIEDMIPLSGPGLTIIMLIVFAIIWAHPISRVCSELSALMPGEGGIYVWAKETLGEFWGFSMSWWGTVSIYLGISAYVVLITDYASTFIPALTDPTISLVTRLGIIALFMIINMIGLKEASWINTVLAVAILIAFAFVTVVGFANWEYSPVTPVVPEGQSIVDSLGGSIMIVVWMYCGYECISNMAGELKDPGVIPKGFKIVMPIIALSYILPTVAGLVSIGSWEEWGTDGMGYGDVLGQCLGYGWGVGFLVIAILSQAAIYNAYVAEGSRGFFVMADDHLAPKFLVMTNKKGLPVLSILLLSVCTAILCQFDFSTILIMMGPLALMVYVILGLCLLKARKEFPVEERDCWYIKNPVLAKAFAIIPMPIAIIALLVNGTEYFLLGFCSICSAVFAYVIIKWIYKGLYKVDAEKYPLNPKTKLAQGDLQRFGAFFLAFGIYAFIGTFFLQWYEGSWGPEYYLDTYGSGLISNFALMLKVGRIGGIIGAVVGAVLLTVGKKSDPTTWHGTGEWGIWASDK